MIKKLLISISIVLMLTSCGQNKNQDNRIQIVTTTTMISDMVQFIGGEYTHVQGLMGSGVDPHLYKASEGDVSKLANADIIVYNGLHLEGKLEAIFNKMKQRKNVVQISKAIDVGAFIPSENFGGNYDPHIWFHIDYWTACVRYFTDQICEFDPAHKTYYRENANIYVNKLKSLKQENQKLISELPKEKRILITAHDAFNYFGKLYDFQVVGLQGLSTATEAGVKDVQNLAQFIIENNVNAIFVETSVPKRTIEALQASVKSKGHEVKIGGELFSDALGSPNTPEGTYVGMYKHNVTTIVNALK